MVSKIPQARKPSRAGQSVSTTAASSIRDFPTGHDGERLRGRVTKAADFGVFVELGDGSRGFIRRKELSWDEDVRPHLILQRGDDIEVVVLGTDAVSGRLELSYRRAVSDPWQDFLYLYQEGSVARGKVKRLLPGGVFVEIMPGMDGLLPIAQIEFQRVDDIDQVLWLGDDVEVVITEIDRKRRRLRVSLKERLRQINREDVRHRIREHAPGQSFGATIGERTGISAEALKARLCGQREEREETIEGLDRYLERVLKVLLVDDEADLRVPMAEQLASYGCQCVTASNGQEGCRAALADDYDVIFLDIGLPDMDGIEIARKTLEHKPQARIVMISGIALAEERASELDDIESTRVLIKPLDPVEIRELLAAIAQGENAFELLTMPVNEQGSTGDVDFVREISVGRDPFAPLEETLVATLAAVREVTQAEVAAIFSMDLMTRSAALIAQEGQRVVEYDADRHPLEISPVKDVIIGHEHIFETNVHSNAPGKFRYLLPLLDFNSCIGVPIEVGRQIRHGLFLFHGDIEAFILRDLQRALAASVTLGVAMERAELDQTMLTFQNLSLQGQLSAGLAHDMNNKLSGVLFKAQHLADLCSNIEKELTDLTLTRQVSDMKQGLSEVIQMSSALRRTARLFQTLMRAKSESMADVNRIIHTTLDILQPVAHMAKVDLRSRLCPDLPRVPAVGVRLEQAFLNITVNAIQQIGVFSPSGGTLEVSTAYEPGEPRWPIKIRFCDDGPGVHRQLFDKIFALGFTTRQEGSGLGLYITKGLIESIGGRVSVEDSVMLLGTTFLVELPAIIAR